MFAITVLTPSLLLHFLLNPLHPPGEQQKHNERVRKVVVNVVDKKKGVCLDSAPLGSNSGKPPGMIRNPPID